MVFNKQKEAGTRYFYVDGDHIIFIGEYEKKEISAISDMIRKHLNEKEKKI